MNQNLTWRSHRVLLLLMDGEKGGQRGRGLKILQSQVDYKSLEDRPTLQSLIKMTGRQVGREEWIGGGRRDEPISQECKLYSALK